MLRSSSAVVAALTLGACASNASLPPQDPPAERRVQQSAPVVVTARKWEESPRDVPSSVTAFSRSQLELAGIDSVRDASRHVPNMMVTEFSSRRLSFPYIRGVGSGQGEPAVATFIDGVPQLTVSSTNLPLVGVERVEVLRGPSGALYGRNTLGGAIHVHTAEPSNQAEIEVATTFGNYDLQRYGVALSTPIVDDELFFDAAVQYEARDGYTDNTLTGNDVDFRDAWYARSGLTWRPDADNEVRVAVHGETARDGGFVLTDVNGLRANPHQLTQDFEGRTERDLVGGSITWDNHGDDVDFKSITGLHDWRIAESADFDFSFLDGVRRFTREDETYVYQEFRLGSSEDRPIDIGRDAELQWLAGVTGFYSEESRSAANEFRPGGAGILFPPANVGTDRARGDFESAAFGAYAQATVTLYEDLEIAGALRYDLESRDAELSRQFETGGFVIPTGASDDSETFDEISPRASLSYRFAEEIMAYAVAARGFKAGGFNLTAPAGSETFGPETSWSYEAGVKTTWADEKVDVNVAFFHVDWDDMQLSQFDATSGGYVTNAGDAESQGVEVEVVVRPVPMLELFGTVGYTDTEFERFVDSFGQNVAGNNLPFAPETTVSAGAQLKQELHDDVTLRARAEYFHVGEFFFDAGNLGRERYELVNFRAGVGGKGWQLDGWLENAFDEEWIPVAFQPSPVDPTLFVGESGTPRIYGVSLAVTF